jgi:hypothetical protein
MMVELPDGRVLSFSDSMTEEDVQTMVKLYMENKTHATEAVNVAKAEVLGLRTELAQRPKQVDNVSLEIHALRKEMQDGLTRLQTIMLMDRELVRNEVGDFTRSRVVPPK